MVEGKVGKRGSCFRGCACSSFLLSHKFTKLLGFYAVQGPNASSAITENLAEELAKYIVEGELYVGDWSSEKGAQINVLHSLFAIAN